MWGARAVGLRFADDLAAWRRWQESRNPLRALKARTRRAPQPRLVLHLRGESPSILLAVEATTPSAVAAAAAPLVHLGDLPVAVLAPADVTALLPGSWTTQVYEPGARPPGDLQGLRAVIATGHYLPAGAAAYAWSLRVGARFLVVQHGLLTPFAPPLPPRAHLLAFSARDAEFWMAGRSDVTSAVVGSQLLWSAAQRPRPAEIGTRPLFLGQLHGAELSRRTAARTAARFCRDVGADYRPHPAEVDRRSRWQHAAWERQGIRVVRGGELLAQARPVVSIFSTGVLEAAAAGIPAWVTCEGPPVWVREFWDRYELVRWGDGAPTPAPPVPPVEPAATVATTAMTYAVEGAG